MPQALENNLAGEKKDQHIDQWESKINIALVDTRNAVQQREDDEIGKRQQEVGRYLYDEEAGQRPPTAVKAIGRIMLRQHPKQATEQDGLHMIEIKDGDHGRDSHQREIQ